jgi:hypothetical protein
MLTEATRHVQFPALCIQPESQSHACMLYLKIWYLPRRKPLKTLHSVVYSLGSLHRVNVDSVVNDSDIMLLPSARSPL